MARFFVRFRHSDTGLTPVFTFFKKVSDLTDITPPSIVAALNGTYYFDYAPTFDIVFEVDGGATIPTEEERYVGDVIGPPPSVWDELLALHQIGGSSGRILNDLLRLLVNKTLINTSTNKLEVYDDTGTTVIFSWDLKDSGGAPTSTTVFRRLP